MQDPADPARVLGVVTRRGVLGAFDRELLQRDLLLTRVVWSEGGRERADYLELPEGQRVESIAPPPSLLGLKVNVGTRLAWSSSRPSPCPVQRPSRSFLHRPELRVFEPGRTRPGDAATVEVTPAPQPDARI